MPYCRECLRVFIDGVALDVIRGVWSRKGSQRSSMELFPGNSQLQSWAKGAMDCTWIQVLFTLLRSDGRADVFVRCRRAWLPTADVLNMELKHRLITRQFVGLELTYRKHCLIKPVSVSKLYNNWNHYKAASKCRIATGLSRRKWWWVWSDLPTADVTIQWRWHGFVYLKEHVSTALFFLFCFFRLDLVIVHSNKRSVWP